MLKGAITAWASVIAVTALAVGAAGLSMSTSPGTRAVLDSIHPTIPALIWRQVTFGGLRVSVPESWPVDHQHSWGDCGPAGSPFFKPYAVVLDMGIQGVEFSCPDISFNTSIPAMYGIVIDPGPNGPLNGQSIGTCRAVNSLRLCPSTSYGGIQVFAVYVIGESQPVAIEVGLAGNGEAARRILASIRPSETHTLPTTSTTEPTVNDGPPSVVRAMPLPAQPSNEGVLPVGTRVAAKDVLAKAARSTRFRSTARSESESSKPFM
jgi:hypothetical protein